MTRHTVLHTGLTAAIMLATVATRADDAVVWKAGDRGVTLQDTPLISGKTRLGAIPAGIELTAEKVQGKWIPGEADQETVLVREGYLLWIREADTAYLVPSSTLTGVTRPNPLSSTATRVFRGRARSSF